MVPFSFEKFPVSKKFQLHPRDCQIKTKNLCKCNSTTFIQKKTSAIKKGSEIQKYLLMAEKKNKKGNETEEKKIEKKEERGTASTSQDDPQKNKSKKDKRTLRFQLPPSDPIHSEESFTSALSFAWVDDDYEEFVRPEEVHLSVLKKYVLTPLHHSQPRTPVLNPCFHTFLDEEKNMYSPLSSSSSRQLFEVTKHSPTPSDVDITLINSTYLRKLESVKEAIKNGADVNTFRERQTPLLIATEIGDDRLVAYFLSVPNVNPDFQNDFGQTPLIVAVRNAFDNIVRLLLTHNADVNIPDNMGKTPLHGALFQQRPHLVKLLLAYGADCEKPDYFGEKPIYTSAVKKPHLECLLTLMRMGACPNHHNVTGIPLLSRAILNWTEFSIIEALVQYGASVNAFDLTTKKTALHFAAITDDIRVAKFLVSQGADTNIKTTYNFTPYEEAVFHRSANVAEFLVNITNASSPKFIQSIRPPISY